MLGPIDPAELVEHDPWVELYPEKRQALEEAGFKTALMPAFDHEGHPSEEPEIVAWYHPDHWECYSIFDGKAPDREPDTWLHDYNFFAKTDAARARLTAAEES